MGKTTRWFKDFFGFKGRQKHNPEYSLQPGSRFISGSGPLVIPPNISPAEAAWLRSFYNEPDNRQKQHARAVAAATAAAADAALATALAAAKVVHLTSQGREKLAAAKIQTVFRGYLARKALRALRALVKIQALVRGFLVRKQTTATLRRMQALIRSQEIIRALKEHPATVSKRLSSSATNAYDKNSKIVEIDTGCWPKSRRISQPVYLESSSNVVTYSPLSYVESKNQGRSLNLEHYMSAELKAKQRSQSAPRQRLTRKNTVM